MAEFTKEQLIDHIRDMMESAKEMIDGNGVPVEFVVRAERDIAVYEIALAVLTAEPVCRSEIINKVHGMCSRLPGATFSNAAEFAIDEVMLRLPLLEGLK